MGSRIIAIRVFYFWEPNGVIMPKKSLSPVLTLAFAALAAPCALSAQEADEANPNANQTLDTMVVTATRTEEAMREVTVNTTVITAEKIRKSTATTMDQLLSREGFYVINQGTQKTLQIRGMGQSSMSNELESNVLVLLNGRRIGANNVALMGLDNIDRVEIIRGPSAVQFGSSAMGGVVNIITKRGIPGQTEAAAEFGLGSYGLYKGIMSLSGGVDAFDFSGSVTQWGRDDYDVSGGDQWKHTRLDSSTSMNLDMGYTLREKHRLGLNFNYYNLNDTQSPGDGWRNSGRPGGFAYGDYNNYDLKNYNLAFLYEGAARDDRFTWFARYSFGKDENEGIYKSADHSYMTSTNDYVDNKAFAAQGAFNGEMFSLAAGLDYIKYDVDKKSYHTYGTLPDLNSTQKNTAGYLSAKLRLFDEALIISTGGRFDHFKNEVRGQGSKSDNNFAPSIGLAVLPADWLKFRGNYSEGFKVGSPRQMIGYNSGQYTWIGNSNLNPEKSKTFEFGVDAAWNFLDAGLTYFHTNWDDKIVSSGLGPNVFQYQNVKAATIAGLELALGANLGQAFDLDFDLRPYLNLTYLGTRKNKDRRGPDYSTSVQYIGSGTLLLTPKYMVAYGLDFASPDHDFKANINAVYSGQILTADWNNIVDWNLYKPAHIKHSGGTVVDLSLSKGLIDFDDRSKLSLKADINNIFDDDNDNYFDYPGPGRNFYLGLRYEFS